MALSVSMSIFFSCVIVRFSRIDHPNSSELEGLKRLEGLKSK